MEGTVAIIHEDVRAQVVNSFGAISGVGWFHLLDCNASSPSSSCGSSVLLHESIAANAKKLEALSLKMTKQGDCRRGPRRRQDGG
jgi:hypothetical protein